MLCETAFFASPAHCPAWLISLNQSDPGCLKVPIPARTSQNTVAFPTAPGGDPISTVLLLCHIELLSHDRRLMSHNIGRWALLFDGIGDPLFYARLRLHHSVRLFLYT